jgi:surface antigen
MASKFSYDAWDDDLAYARASQDDSINGGVFYPGERIGAPPPTRTLIALKRILAMTAVTAATWGGWETRDTWKPVLQSAQQYVRPAEVPKPAQPEETVAVPPAALQPLASGKDVADVAGSATNPLGSPAATATSAKAPIDPASSPTNADTSVAAPSNPPAPSPLPAPEIDAKNKKQKKAAAIGLHPGVSAVLLSSMSETDYRNAAQAIRRALAETADTDKFIWPRESKPKLARFQVHFVQSAGPDCRRYVVTVVKNGWTTTAPPIEKCGIPKPGRRAVTALPIQSEKNSSSFE